MAAKFEISNKLALETCERIVSGACDVQGIPPQIENLANAYAQLFKAASEYVSFSSGLSKGEFDKSIFPWEKYENLKKAVAEA